MAHCPRCSQALPDLAQACPFCGEVLSVRTVPGLAGPSAAVGSGFDETLKARGVERPGHEDRHALSSTLPNPGRRGGTVPLGMGATPAEIKRAVATAHGVPRDPQTGAADQARPRDPVREGRQRTWLGGSPASPSAERAALVPEARTAVADAIGSAHDAAPGSARGRVRERHDVALRASAFPSRPAESAPLLRKPSILVAAALSTVVLLFGASWMYFAKSGELKLVDSQVDESGHTRLVLSCGACGPDSVVRFGSASARIAAGQAVLPLGGSLPPGANSLTLTLEAPGTSPKEYAVSAEVPFLVKTDWRLLAEERPQAEIVIHAVPRSAVVVEGHAVNLDPFGVGRHAIDLTRELSGLAPETTALQRNVAYAVTTPEGRAQRGELRMELPIAELDVEAPGDHLVTESATFTLAGNTHPNATLSVAGRPIAVDAKGHFAQLMNISAPGDTRVLVRASLADHAPRLFSIHVERVRSLNEYAEQLRPLATDSYAALIEGASTKSGWQVALRGQIVGMTARGHRIDRELSVSPCPQRPCTIVVTHAGAQGPGLHRFVEVFGRVLGGGTTDPPRIEADFFLEAEPDP